MTRFTIVQENITPGLKLVKDAAKWEIRRLKHRGKHVYQRMMRLWRNRIRTSWNKRPRSHQWHHPLWSGASSHLHKLELPLDQFPPKDRSCRRTPRCGDGCSALQPARIQTEHKLLYQHDRVLCHNPTHFVSFVTNRPCAEQSMLVWKIEASQMRWNT